MPAKLSLKKNVIWNSSGSFIYLFFQWLVNYLVVVLLGFHDAGIFSLAIAITSVAFAASLYGVRGYQVSDLRRKYSDKSYIIARLVTCVLSIIGVIIYLIVNPHELYTSVCILAYLGFKMAEALVDVYHGIIQRGMRMDYIGKSFIIRGVISNILFIACAILTKNLLFSILVLAISSFALVYTYDYRKLRLFYKEQGTSARLIFNLLFECLPLAIYSLLSNLIAAIPRINLEAIKGTEVLGIYASIAIPAAVIQVVAGFVFAPVLSVFADHVDKRNFKLFHKLLFKVVLYIFSLSIIAITAGGLIGDFGLRLLFGNHIAPYTYLFMPVLYISSLTAFSWFIGLMLTVIRDFVGLIVSSITAVSICIAGGRLFIHMFSVNGASFILILALLVQIAIMSMRMALKLKVLQNQPNTHQA